MFSGFAFYNLEQTSPEEALAVGLDFFTKIECEISGASVFKLLQNGDHPGDHEILEVTTAELEKKTKTKNATAFRLFYEDKNFKPWLASFGYSTNEFSGLTYVDIQFNDSIIPPETEITLFTQIALQLKSRYSIAFKFPDILKSFYYASGDNLVCSFKNENPSTFKKTVFFQGSENIFSQNNILRLIYPYNIINTQHLQIRAKEQSLESWIHQAPQNGDLIDIGHKMYLWKVLDTELDRINDELGKENILISWKNTTSKKQKLIP